MEAFGFETLSEEERSRFARELLRYYAAVLEICSPDPRPQSPLVERFLLAFED